MNQIENKEKEIEQYKIILAKYRGRWWDQGKRHLEELEKELELLIKNKGPFGPL